MIIGTICNDLLICTHRMIILFFPYFVTIFYIKLLMTRIVIINKHGFAGFFVHYMLISLLLYLLRMLFISNCENHGFVVNFENALQLQAIIKIKGE